MCEFGDLINICGEANSPGVKIKTFMVPAEDIDVFPALKASTNPGDTITLDGDIILKANKAWKRLDILTDSGEVKDVLVGSPGSKSWESTFDHIVPKANAEQLEYHNCTANACFVMIVQDKQGKFRVLGNPDLPAKIETNEVTTGKDSGGSRGATVQVKSSVGTPAPFYIGLIDLDPLT